MKASFIPPAFDLPFAWTLDLSFPFIAKLLFNLDSIQIHKDDQHLISGLKNKRLLYLSNYPTNLEPAIAYYVANEMGSRFHFMASRSLFNLGFGVIGELIKRVGAFSIITGSADRDAIKMARKILSEPAGKLVLYPEGIMSGENDNLASFLPGVAQIAFGGLEDALKKDPSAELIVQPAFVKYLISGSKESILREIENSLQRIERKLRLFPGGRTILRRFLTIGRVLLEETEFELGVPKSEIEGKDFDYRLGRARHTALNQAGNILNIKFKDTDHAIDKIRQLLAVLDHLDTDFQFAKEKGLTPQNIRRARQLVDTAYTFIITKPKNLIQFPSAERLMEWIGSFEKHVFGKSGDRARKAEVLLAPSFSLNEYLKTYQSNKREGISHLMTDIRNSMETLVERGRNLSEPIVPPYSVGLDLHIG
ncbi:acyltransferase [Leptospira ryugenii]|uniref:Acyltransferase n=1 Tax=Leptospira ryugenii TaxID=1917863 RepID=A0A2P2E421_9LEPT|nr:1-acyl-sn-glycerol-3-phosphate acyltransferase [Leptospira ryugenii]GBF51623.1 acyltransferase [Leptospira ryugenii]